MKSKKLVISLLAAGVLSVGFGPSLPAADAEQHICKVTLVGGASVTLTLPSCGSIPPLAAPVVSVVDVTPPAETTPTTSTPTPTETTPASTTEQPKPSGGPIEQPGTATTPTRTTSNAAPRKTTTTKKSESEADLAATKAKQKAAARKADGVPTTSNPSFSFSVPGPAAIGVPNFFIEKFRIPPFLLPIYQAAGIEYGVPWQILAAINEIETDYGRNLNTSSAGAMGWMQFIPSSWKSYGVDGNNDGRKDPYNPVDAIFAAGRYLKAAGAEKNLHDAIFSYNHAEWYVDSVMLRAKLIGGLPNDLIASITGLTQGHFPVAAKSVYADDQADAQATKRTKSATIPVESSPNRHGINVYSKPGSPVVAVNDGIIKRVGENDKVGKFVVLQDVYGNNFTYSELGEVAPTYPSPKPQTVNQDQIRKELELPKADPKPSGAASAGRQAPAAPAATPGTAAAATQTVTKERLFAHPSRPAAYKAGGSQQLLQTGKPVAGYETFDAYFKQVLGLGSKDVELKKLQPGAQVIAGTVLGRVDKTKSPLAPHVHFVIRPAGKGSPAIDPKPILDGWKLLESTAIYRAAGKNPFFGPDAKNPSIGQLLLLSKEALERRVLADPRIEIYDCGRRDIQSGQIDRRVLATLAFLTASGLKPTVSALKCGHSYYTSAGGVSEHSSGNAVDVAAINGIPIIGHQGAGSITDITIRRLLSLQGVMKPHQIISLMTFKGTDNTLSLSDHNDHIHIGFFPLFGSNGKLGQQFNAVLKPDQWVKLIDRLSQIDNPVVPVKPSKASIPVKSSRAG
jgi:hypothetical protein